MEFKGLCIDSDGRAAARLMTDGIGVRGGGGGRPSPILVEIKAKPVPSKDLSLLLAPPTLPPPDSQTFRQPWLGFKW